MATMPPSAVAETGARAMAGIVGWPVDHSRSPLIHGYWLEALGINGVYERYPVSPDENFEAAIRALAAKAVLGVNVTIPHKEAAFQIADHTSDAAQRLGAANVLIFSGGEIFADNTDGYGFIANLDAHLSRDRWVGQTACVVGAGGAARAIVGSLIEAGCVDLKIINRSMARAEGLADLVSRCGGRAHLIALHDTIAVRAALAETALIINTTSLGMSGHDALDLDISALPPEAVVSDIVYVPLETQFLAQARARGLATVDGLGMLLYQAIPAFAAWFGQTPEVTPELRRLVEADIGV